jgi:hypothetical protein
MSAEQLNKIASILGDAGWRPIEDNLDGLQEALPELRAALGNAGEVVAWGLPHDDGGCFGATADPKEADEWRSLGNDVRPLTYADAPAVDEYPPVTDCAVCGLHDVTPILVDRLGGYVCLPCITDELNKPVPAVAAEPVYCVPTGDVSEGGRETYTHHAEPVPMADNIVLYTHPPASPADALDAARWKIDLPKLVCVLDGLAADVHGNCVASRVCIGVLDGKEVQLLVTTEEGDLSGDEGFVCIHFDAAMAQGGEP